MSPSVGFQLTPTTATILVPSAEQATEAQLVRQGNARPDRTPECQDTPELVEIMIGPSEAPGVVEAAASSVFPSAEEATETQDPNGAPVRVHSWASRLASASGKNATRLKPSNRCRWAFIGVRA